MTKVENRDDSRRAAVTSTARPGPGRWPVSPGGRRRATAWQAPPPLELQEREPGRATAEGSARPGLTPGPRNLPNRKGPGGTPAARRGGSQLSGWRRARPSGQQRAPSR